VKTVCPTKQSLCLCIAAVLFCTALQAAGEKTVSSRRIISLDGTWEIAEGALNAFPDSFTHHVPVPGLVDMASPAFPDVGTKSSRREAFWYRRTFRLEGPLPDVAWLKIHKAKFGTSVFLNGCPVGDRVSCFTPLVFDIRDVLKGSGAENEILIRVGAFRDSVPATVPTGHDFEKVRYIPGIYDSVELILCNTPTIVRIQAVPDVPAEAVRIETLIENGTKAQDVIVTCQVREVSSGEIAASGATQAVRLAANQQHAFDLRLPIENCHLWSPEDPFLYELEATTGGDTLRVRFGMRSFRFDKDSGRAILNGKPYMMRGTNVCIFRFFEDPSRGNLPWRTDWVRTLHRRFKSMHWNAIRYCIGFPPEIWYEIADEVGFLIQDEFPLWGKPETLRSEQLVKEYTAWMQERWNHPCVVIWDAQNETITPETGKALNAVRHLDLSNRPWDNGWSEPQVDTDGTETHPYLFPQFRKRKPGLAGPLAELLTSPRIPHNGPNERSRSKKKFPNANIINEYAWLWLNRDGTPTTLTEDIYKNLLGIDASRTQLRKTYARYLAALTEYWRCHRKAAGVLHFCGLGYSRSGSSRGQTSDNFIDIEKLTFEPHFEHYVRDAFSPVGLMIDAWAEVLPAGVEREFPVVVINDLYEDWKGTVRLRLVHVDKTIADQSQACACRSLGRAVVPFKLTVPMQPGAYQLVAELITGAKPPIRSLRDFKVVADAPRQDE